MRERATGSSVNAKAISQLVARATVLAAIQRIQQQTYC
jgi:hypothetical protein